MKPCAIVSCPCGKVMFTIEMGVMKAFCGSCNHIFEKNQWTLTLNNKIYEKNRPNRARSSHDRRHQV